MDKSVLITGANGLIGKGICQLLHKNNLPFKAVARTQNHDPLAWEVLYLNLLEKESFRVLTDLPISYVIHCAAILPRDSSLEASILAAEANQELDKNVFSYAQKIKAKLIYLSGTSIYGFEANVKIDESYPVDENLSPYIKQKYLSELLAIKLNPDAIILRVSAPYGPEQKSNTVLKNFILKALKGENITYYGSGNRKQDFTYVADIAEAVLLCINDGNIGGIFNIASGVQINMKDLAELVVKRVPGSKSKIMPAGMPDSQENFQAQFSIEKAEKKLHWRPFTSLQKGVDNWVKYLQK